MAQRQTFSGAMRMIEALITFWGVRGSFVTQENRIGGHTTCMSIEYPGCVIVIDSGTAWIDLARYLRAKYLTGKDSRLVIHVIQTHLHQDHIAGFSACDLVFDPRVTFEIYGSLHDGLPGERLTAMWVLEHIVFRPPFFPMPWSALKHKFNFHEFNPDHDHFTIPTDIGGIEVETRLMKHPNQAYALKFNIGGEFLAVTMDHNADEILDDNVIQHWSGSKVVISEVQYTEMVYRSGKESWGHMSDTQAARHARLAGLDSSCRLYPTHHDIIADFDMLFQICEKLTDVAGVKTEPAIQGCSFLF